MIRRSIAMAAALTLTAASLTAAPPTQQTGNQPPPTYEQQITGVWKQLHNKILAMARDTEFPDARLGWRPHPDSRSMFEEYRHVTIGLEMSAAQLRGEPFDYAARLKADEGKPATRASVVADMEAAIARSYPLVEQQPSPRLVFWVDHQAEHYGKLVSNYRMNGIVPPVSRR